MSGTDSKLVSYMSSTSFIAFNFSLRSISNIKLQCSNRVLSSTNLATSPPQLRHPIMRMDQARVVLWRMTILRKQSTMRTVTSILPKILRALYAILNLNSKQQR